MTTLIVRPGGLSLGKALSTYLPGDVIDVRGGTYDPATVARGSVRIVFRDGAAIDGDRKPGADHGLLIRSSWVTIEGAEVRDVSGGGIIGASGVHHVTVKGSYVHGNDGHGIHFSGGSYYNIIGNEVCNNVGLMSRDIRHTSGISIMGPRDVKGADVPYEVRIVGNKVHHNGTEASTDGFGIIADDFLRNGFKGAALIADNAIWENGNSGLYVHKSDRVTARDNLLWHNAQDATKARATEIGINGSHDVRLIGNVAEAERDGFVFYSGGGSTATLSGNRFYADGHGADHIIAPWSASIDISAATNSLGVDPAQAFPWWSAGNSDHPNWDL